MYRLGKSLPWLVVVCCFVCVGSVGLAAKKPAEPYVIGVIFTVTGDNAPLGVPERETVEMLVKQINAKGGIKGHPIKIVFYDDGGKPDQAVQACQKLLQNKLVLGIVGPTLSGTSLAILNMCNEAKVPLMSCAASIKIVQPVTPYVFKTAQDDAMAVGRLIDYCKKRGYKKVAFINDSNAYGSSGREQWLKQAKAAGIDTVAVESFSTADTDMTAQLSKIRATGPQAVVCWGTNPGPAIVAKNMRSLGMKQPLLQSHGIANMEFIKLAGSAAEGVVFPAGKLIVAKNISRSDPQRPVLLKYAADFEKTYKKAPNTFGGHAYDAFMLLVKAIEKAGPNRSKIRDVLENTRGFVGITGVFNFSPKDHNGLSKSSFALVTIKNGKWTLVK
ncbi:MAG: ABC transporter substrate-binding protein [Armatimonadota bacterium]|nr:ABC transporter substrate-binding protein [Armatimonadota bacterium]